MGKFSLLSKVILVALFVLWLIFPSLFFFDVIFTGIDVGKVKYFDLATFASILLWYILFRKAMGKKGLAELGENGKRKVIDGDALVFAFIMGTLLTAIWQLVR